MKEMWVGCTMGLLLGQSAWQIDRQSNWPMWNAYSFKPVGLWMRYSFTDLGAEWRCHYLCLLWSHHQITTKFPGVIAIGNCDVNAKGQDQGSKFTVTEVRTQFCPFWTVTWFWTHIWRWNDAQSMMWHRRGALFFFKVIFQISISTWTKQLAILTRIGHFWTVTAV